MIISLDVETTGIDLAHGAMPFLVTTCSDDAQDQIRYWEWPVCPLTRRPDIPDSDLVDIAEMIAVADLVYTHNGKYDNRALAKIGLTIPWDKYRDSFIASHILGSNLPHNLTDCCRIYLGVDMEEYELRVKQVVQQCRAIAKREYPQWVLADEGVAGMPSVKGSSKRDEDKPWKNDMWLPMALANELVTNGDCHEQELDRDWLTACQDYANADSEHTLPLGLEVERLVRERGYWEVYLHRLRLVRADFEMEECGITARGDYTCAVAQEYEVHVAEAECVMTAIAAEFGHDLQLAAGASLNDNMRDFFYGSVHQRCPRCDYDRRVKHWNGEPIPNGVPVVCPKCAGRKRNSVKIQMATTRRDNLALPVILGKKSGNASLDGDSMAEYIETLDDGPALEFVELLQDKRMHDTALQYIAGYRRFWLPVPGTPGYFRIHPSFNPCGTDHLRQSSNSPNLQNVSGDSKDRVISNRECFGPLPGREWWRFDYRSIEARIPAYESGEVALVRLFDHPNDGSHWGSAYNLVGSIFYPEKYRSCGGADEPSAFKSREPKLYKRAKFHWLARQYGAGRAKGDLLAGFAGASEMVSRDLPLLAKLQAKYLADAERLGFVETLPDRTVDPTRGYPILASRTEEGRVLTTTPFNYHTSGTACWVKNQAMVLCSDRCREWRECGFDAHLVCEVHDEILFDFPRGRNMEEHLPQVLELRAIMEGVGGNLIPAIPTPVSLEYIVESWAGGVEVK